MAYDFRNVTVLVVEDNQPMCDMVLSLLDAFGIKRAHSARNGEEGYKAYLKHKPDVIIADWMMKPVDGILFTQKIRTNPGSPNPYVPIILMTGFSEKKRVVTARDSGVTEFLVKPFTARDLYKRLAQIIERPRQFVKTEVFFGPDRRRKQEEHFEGSIKRFDDNQLDMNKTISKPNKYDQEKDKLKK